ncbi:MAG TPA: HAMP domain-containing sensor histidine kinase [Phototrophicaceae bacterium]|nr:HAMP domain-containing sensor histidine kinase [Phototrophicaceae bacterium]
MTRFLTSIRTRLLLVYVGILFVGFLALTLVAGQQISSSARADYEQRLKNEIQLIAQGLRAARTDPNTTEADLTQLLSEYALQTGGAITVIGFGPGDRRPPIHRSPEIDAAFEGNLLVMERENDFGQINFYTAAPITEDNQERQQIVVQLSVPAANLQRLVGERWLSLGMIFALITLVALGSAILVARSIIRPLSALRETAVQLATGDFSHRVAYNHPDEIGEVAHAFNNMAQQVESMLEEQRAFASNTSHELRTPLTTIRLRTEALRYDEQLDTETSEQYITEIDDEANRMGALIEDLTLLSRFDAGRAELGSNQIDMEHFAANLFQRLRPAAQSKNIELQLVAAPNLLPITASLNHLTVVFRNLIDNAIKYTPGAGTITWTIYAETNGVRSLIQDTGRGIEPDQLPHLFERFYRADKSRSRDIPGSGLGLAIVKSIVEAYGGSIAITSPGSGQGTTVTVFWPYQPIPIR